MKEKQTITVSEFKAWLAGVEDMQGANWIPSKEQWKKIRNKINILVDTPTTNVMQTNNLQPAYLTNPAYAPSSVNVPPIPPSVLAPMELKDDVGVFDEAGKYVSSYL